MQRRPTVSDGSSFHKNDTEDDEEQALLGAGGVPAHTTASVTSGFQTDPSLKEILTGQEELPPRAPACSQVCTGDSWGRFPPVSGQRPGEEHRQKVCEEPDHRTETLSTHLIKGASSSLHDLRVDVLVILQHVSDEVWNQKNLVSGSWNL